MQNKSCVLGALLTLWLARPAFAAQSAMFQVVPLGKWVYKDVDRLVKFKIASYPDDCHYTRGYKHNARHCVMTRYEFAVVTQRVLKISAERERAARKRNRNLTGDLLELAQIGARLKQEFHAELAEITAQK